MRIRTPPSDSALVVTLLIMGSLLTSCGSKEARQRAEQGEQAAAEAQMLGQEVWDLVDRTMAYQSSHSGRLPRRLRDVGIDSLTPTTMRWLKVRRGSPHVTVAYRRPAGHLLISCSGSDAILEDLALSGAFELVCTDGDGAESRFSVVKTP
jgi:hypothetical protein